MKLAVCMPSRDMVHSRFCHDLACLGINFGARLTKNKGDAIMTLVSMGTLLVDQRENLVEEAISSGATHILWLDTDMTFPPDVVERLEKHNKPVVTCNYVKRGIPTMPVAYKSDGKQAYPVNSNGKTGLEEVDVTGLGVCLMDVRVFKDIPKPWFLMGYNPNTGKHMGEDVYFFRKLKDAGYKCWVDHDLSREVGHIGTFEYRHEHVTACEEACDKMDSAA